MDIQEMVENRIRELRANEEAPPKVRESESEQESGMADLTESDQARPFRASDIRPTETSRQQEETPHYLPGGNKRSSERGAEQISGMNDFSDLIDERLSQLILRMLELSERISVNYGQLEQDLLRSRLEILQGAEEVLDIALSLRKRCRELSGKQQHLSTDTSMKKSSTGDIDDFDPQDFHKRVSMRTMGVADLFRRT